MCGCTGGNRALRWSLGSKDDALCGVRETNVTWHFNLRLELDLKLLMEFPMEGFF